MSDYKMKDRRPIGELYRKMGYGFVDVLVEKNVNPNTISYLSMVFATIAALLLWKAGTHPWLLLIAPLFGFFRLYCNMVDGMVAVKANKCSASGEVINELPDRISDIIIFAGLAGSGLASSSLSLWVIIGSLFVAYIGVLGKSVGAERQFGGVMSKQWRMFALAGGCWSTSLVELFWSWPFSLSILDWTAILVLVGLGQTALVRTFRVFIDIASKRI
jgi:phosphatidylglycerophosphate synthase